MEFLEPYWYVSLPAGLFACFIFFLMRWQRPKPGNGVTLNLSEYIRYDLNQFIKGAGMYLVLYFVWSLLPELSRFDISYVENLPGMNTPLAVAIGFASKKIWDYTLKKFMKMG